MTASTGVGSDSAFRTPPPCSSEPDRWLDRQDRLHALTTCLRCPVRQWCAEEALRVRPSLGMWAGVWIDCNLAEVSCHLHAIAGGPSLAPPRIAIPATSQRETPSVDRRPFPLPRPALWSRRASVNATVLGRSSGHCEIFGPDCRLSADVHVSRMPGIQASTASSLYASCNSCAVSAEEPAGRIEARRRGHVIESPGLADHVPFFWRSSRWVYLGSRGELYDADPDAVVVDRSARAS